MKSSLIVAALLSAAFAALPAVPAVAADTLAKPNVAAECFVVPLLPDCTAQWNAEWKAKGFHWTPVPVAWWTCEPAAAGSGHLLDCATDA